MPPPQTINYPAEDVPFTASGMQPDIIFSPFGMRRMTVGHIIETMASKVGALGGRYIDVSVLFLLKYKLDKIKHLILGVSYIRWLMISPGELYL